VEGKSLIKNRRMEERQLKDDNKFGLGYVALVTMGTSHA
jgi:hypothetical protein